MPASSAGGSTVADKSAGSRSTASPAILRRRDETPAARVWDASSGRVSQFRQLFGTESVGEVLMEANAVSVWTLPGGPIGEPTVDAVERLERVLTCRLVDDHAKVASVQPSFAGDRAFFVGRQPLDLPRWQEQIRKGDDGSSEDVSHDPRPAFRPIQVHDVRELVGDHQAQPVVGREFGTTRPGRGRSQSCRRAAAWHSHWPVRSDRQ